MLGTTWVATGITHEEASNVVVVKQQKKLINTLANMQLWQQINERVRVRVKTEKSKEATILAKFCPI